MPVNVKSFFYAYIIALFSFFVFLFGFFPLNINLIGYSNKHDLPILSSHRKNISNLYTPSVNKVVLLIIDAFRNDFLYGSHKNMPFLQELIKNNKTCPFIAEVKTPTVTLPRIKAMTTGYIPAYIDVVLNFGSQKLQTDSLIHQINSLNKTIIFYGDDTWLKLFPSSFKRYEGTKSFYVSDFYEVDLNVTRNIENELLNDDWSLMILHYLGLDHIGHVEGPRGKHLKPKLNEMDNIIKKIYTNLIDMSSRDSLLVITGDHGMRDSGGHGGSSKPETYVPLIFAGMLCNNTTSKIEEVKQIDLVPTLSILFGAPIPKGSIGKLIDSVIKKIDSKQKLYALYYNTNQLAKHCRERLDNFQNSAFYIDYIKALTLYDKWLQKNCTDRSLEIQSYILFLTSMNEMSKRLSELGTNYNKYHLILSIIIQFEALVILLLTIITKSNYIQLYKNINKKIFKIAITVIVLTITQKLCTQEVFTIIGFILNLLFSLILCLNHYIIKTIWKSSLYLENVDIESLFIILGIIFHALSLSSTSYIEEEHMTYYHLSSSYFIILLFKYICKVHYKTKNEHNRDKFKYYKEILLLSTSLVALRFLRDLNSTGDKHQNLYDYSDWLNETEHILEYTVIYLISLCGVYITVANYISCNRLLKHTILLYIFYHIYYFKSITNNLLKPNFYVISTDYILLNILFVTLVIYLISFKASSKSRVFLATFLIYLTFLYKPCNVAMLFIIVFILNSILNNSKIGVDSNFWPKYVGVIWIGFAFYYMQGNSNNLATVDVSSGYSGLSSYNPFIVGLQIALLTYSSQLLVVIITLVNIKSNKINSFIKKLCLCKLMPVAWYLTMVYFQRNHLFAWTVFAPKLMYEAMHFIIFFLISLILFVIKK